LVDAVIEDAVVLLNEDAVVLLNEDAVVLLNEDAVVLLNEDVVVLLNEDAVVMVELVGGATSGSAVATVVIGVKELVNREEL